MSPRQPAPACSQAPLGVACCCCKFCEIGGCDVRVMPCGCCLHAVSVCVCVCVLPYFYDATTQQKSSSLRNSCLYYVYDSLSFLLCILFMCSAVVQWWRTSGLRIVPFVKQRLPRSSSCPCTLKNWITPRDRPRSRLFPTSAVRSAKMPPWLVSDSNWCTLRVICFPNRSSSSSSNSTSKATVVLWILALFR